MIYVGSAESESYDQVLDTIYVGPVPEGRHIFVFQADPPDVTRIPEHDAVGVTIILLTCSYRGQEFVRVGYFINNEYSDPELKEMPPAKPQFDKLQRNILDTKPRVTRFKINWEDAVGNNGIGNGSDGEMHAGEPSSSNAPAAAAAADDEQLQQANNAWAALSGGGEGGDGEGNDNGDDMHESGTTPSVVRLNENSNSLAMEC